MALTSAERKALERKRKKEMGLSLYWITQEEYQLITELRRLQSLERDVQESETQH